MTFLQSPRRYRAAIRLAITAAATTLVATTPAGAGANMPTYQWGKKASLPVTLAEVGVAAIGGKVYVVAGSATGEDQSYRPSTSTLYIYDSAKDAWTTGAPLPWTTSHVAVTVLNGKLYAVGGFDDFVHVGAQNKVAVYDPAADRWKMLAPIPTARGSIGLVAVGGRLHAIGGRTAAQVVDVKVPNGPTFKVGLGTVNTHDVYDPATNRWRSAAPLPGAARDHMGVAVLAGKIHVFGGRVNDFNDMQTRHDVFDPVKGRWASAAPLPEARSAGAYTVLDGRIVYAGGECKPGGQPGQPMTFAVALAYSAVYDRWTALPDMPQGHQAFGAATIGKTAYFAAGSPLCGGGGSKDLQTLTEK